LATILTNSWFFFLAAIFWASIVGYSNPHQDNVVETKHNKSQKKLLKAAKRNRVF
jgi:hypothetical protein